MNESKEVYQALQNKYSEERYILQNSYVFDWESDFFFRTTSKLFVEVEVKVSRADFFQDFKKESKHGILNRTFQGHKTYLEKAGMSYEVDYEIEETITPREYCHVLKGYLKRGTGQRRTEIINAPLEKRKFLNSEISEISCNIKIKELPLCPNKFYYACPKDLIKKEEVPNYAGLIYVDNGVAEIVKKAPTIRKDKINLDNVLLEKFYWRCKKLENERS